MRLFKTVFQWFSGDAQVSPSPAVMEVNPATGLPMINGVGSVDVQGNPYGVDLAEITTHHEPSYDDGSNFSSYGFDSFNSSTFDS